MKKRMSVHFRAPRGPLERSRAAPFVITCALGVFADEVAIDGGGARFADGGAVREFPGLEARLAVALAD